MKLIRFRDDGGPVTVEITIEGLLEWRYKYVTDSNRYVRTSDQGSPATHTVGMPGDLHLDSNSWDVQLVNTGDGEADFTVTLSWRQDGQDLEDWSTSGKLPSGDLKVVAGDAFLTRS